MDSVDKSVLDKDIKLKIINEKAVVQVIRAAQGLSKGEIILDYMSVEQALRIEWHSSGWRATVNEEWENRWAKAAGANP